MWAQPIHPIAPSPAYDGFHGLLPTSYAETGYLAFIFHTLPSISPRIPTNRGSTSLLSAMCEAFTPDLTSELNDGDQTSDQLHSADITTNPGTEASSTATSSPASKHIPANGDIKHMDGDASDSELSTLSETPEPPSPLVRDLRKLQHKRIVSCTCEKPCYCAVRSYYNTQTTRLHLGSWALSLQKFPVSAMRSTIGR